MPSLKSIAVVVGILGRGVNLPPPPMHKRYHRHPMHNRVNSFNEPKSLLEEVSLTRTVEFATHNGDH